MPSTLSVIAPLAGPDTSEYTSVSPSGSESLAATLPLMGVSSAVVNVSLPAVGGGLVTIQVKVCEVVTPNGSVAVMTTEYGLFTDAEWSIMPAITPVSGSIVRPAGRLLAENASVSLMSGSAKCDATPNVTASLSCDV